MICHIAWAVEGCLLWQQEGLGDVPIAERPEIEIYPRSSVEDFVETCCVQGDSYRIQHKSLYEAYLRYHEAIADGTEPVADSVLETELSKLGIPVEHSRYGNYRNGIGLKE